MASRPRPVVRGRASGNTRAMQVTATVALEATKRAVLATFDLLYPSRCVGCSRHGPPLCTACIALQVPAHGEGRCGNCSAAWPDPGGYCPLCTNWRHLDGALAAFEHTGAARKAVHGLKYGRQRVLAPSMAEAIRAIVLPGDFDAAVAIPLHPSRRKRRGFNQADLVLRDLGLPPIDGQLQRVRKTRTQVGMNLGQRRRNVGGAFAYTGPELDGLRVALVDDVVTTGATADECAAVLKDYGASSVFAVSFTRMSHRPGTQAIED